MKNRLIRFTALLAYLCILLAAVNFHWRELLSLKLVILVIIGTICLSIPESIQKQHCSYEILSKNAISAGILQTFLLFFANSSGQAEHTALTYRTILCFRPLFYGYCFYILLYTDSNKENREVKTDITDTELQKLEKKAADPYLVFRNLGLTKREIEIAVLLLKGLSNREIAEHLIIAETTVKKHISNIFLKLKISRREQLADLVNAAQKPGE